MLHFHICRSFGIVVILTRGFFVELIEAGGVRQHFLDGFRSGTLRFIRKWVVVTLLIQVKDEGVAFGWRSTPSAVSCARRHPLGRACRYFQPRIMQNKASLPSLSCHGQSRSNDRSHVATVYREGSISCRFRITIVEGADHQILDTSMYSVGTFLHMCPSCLLTVDERDQNFSCPCNSRCTGSRYSPGHYRHVGCGTARSRRPNSVCLVKIQAAKFQQEAFPGSFPRKEGLPSAILSLRNKTIRDIERMTLG